MYVSRYVAVATEFQRRTKDGTKAQDEYPVNMTEPEILIQDGLVRVGGVCDSGWFGQANHVGLKDYPHHINDSLECVIPVASPDKWMEGGLI